jgi:hypothetical protein
MNTVQLSAMLPRDARFREWVKTFTPHLDAVNEHQAAQFIRLVCEIESRAELETNKEAERRFHELLRRPFITWRDDRRRTH